MDSMEIVWTVAATLGTGGLSWVGSKVISHETRISVAEKAQEVLKEDLQEIKQDVKELLRHANGKSKG